MRPAFERDWTIVALGDTLLMLGHRESSTARLKEAVTAYPSARAVFVCADARKTR